MRHTHRMTIEPARPHIDHVLIPVTDLGAAVAAFEARYGLRSVAGGRHPGWGTANRIVPLGAAYLELVSIVEPEAAGASSFGRWVAASAIDRPMGWAVRVEDIETVARRLGLAVTAGRRAGPDGRQIGWRTVGVDRAAAETSLPFFIAWDAGTDLPGRAAVQHPIGDARLARIIVRGDPRRVAAWLGPHRLPIEIRAGASSIVEVVLEARDREIRIG